MDKYNLGVIQQGFSKTVLYDNIITSTGTYALSDSVYNYKLIIVEHGCARDNNMYKQSFIIVGIYNDPNSYMACNGYGTNIDYASFHFSNDGNNIVVDAYEGENITKIVGIN